MCIYVRDPLNRALSVYYFWGELFRLALSRKRHKNNRRKKLRHRIGLTDTDLRDGDGDGDGNTSSIDRDKLESHQRSDMIKGMFLYHGDESTAPPHNVAVQYAKDLPYRAGMPGPSYTWSLFSRSLGDALSVLQSGRVFVIVTERLDESLVAASHYLGWSLADVVVTKPRKHLSSHPKAKDWPQDAVMLLNNTLKVRGEYEVYEMGHAILDANIKKMQRDGIDVYGEVDVLRRLRKRVQEVR